MTETTNSEIAAFYKDSSVLITGASGFMGKLLVEQLLRKCQPKKLYLLIRSKRGISPSQRIKEIFKNPLFDDMKKSKPNFMDCVELIEGDMTYPDLGLSKSAISIILEKIEIVFHTAATVKFDEHINLATSINVQGTKSLILLCHKIKNLKSFVYVSTAFSHCPREEIDEIFYDTPITADNLIRLTQSFKESQLTVVSKAIIDKWPNTYTFTKAVAEDAVKTYAKGLPACIFRPAIMTGTSKEPLAGWIDNLYGPTGLVFGIGAGIIRTVQGDSEASAEIVPADMTINALIAASYKNYIMEATRGIAIYNYVSSTQNKITWRNYMEYNFAAGEIMPMSKAAWHNTVWVIRSRVIFLLYCFLVHTLPALFIDLILICLNKKPRILKIYRRAHKFMNLLSFFAIRSWSFHNNNIQELWSGLNETDKKNFDFDISKVNWLIYIRNALYGIRLYLFNDSLETIQKAKRKKFWFLILHRTVQLLFFTLLFGMLYIPLTTLVSI